MYVFLSQSNFCLFYISLYITPNNSLLFTFYLFTNFTTYLFFIIELL